MCWKRSASVGWAVTSMMVMTVLLNGWCGWAAKGWGCAFTSAVGAGGGRLGRRAAGRPAHDPDHGAARQEPAGHGERAAVGDHRRGCGAAVEGVQGDLDDLFGGGA